MNVTFHTITGVPASLMCLLLILDGSFRGVLEALLLPHHTRNARKTQDVRFQSTTEFDRRIPMSTETIPQSAEATVISHDAATGHATHGAHLLTVSALLTAVGTDTEILPWEMIQKVLELMSAA